MNNFFRAETAPSQKKMRRGIFFAAAAVLLIQSVASLVLLLNLRDSFDTATNALWNLLGLNFVLCLVAALLLEYANAGADGAARYTYLEIGERAALFSKYGGSGSTFGKKQVRRELWIIPFENLVIEQTGRFVTLKGAVKHYEDRAANLNYEFRDGAPVFTEWWYNHGSFDTIKEFHLTQDFVNGAAVYQALMTAKANFDSLPPKKPYVHVEPKFVKINHGRSYN
ncbi:MAG: hypothetical protein LBN40_02440 [Oscillospiraceae bacterium]|jgi:hypothetical protein|nr:hypothetical protein [Oscillospiraceae bacterium]